MPQAVADGLTSRGHVVAVRDGIGACQAIGWRDGKPFAVGEPRVNGSGRVTEPNREP